MQKLHGFHIGLLILLTIMGGRCIYLPCPATASFATCYECYQLTPLLPIQCVCYNFQFALVGRCLTATYPCVTSYLSVTNDAKYPQYNIWTPLIMPFWQNKVDLARNNTTPPSPLPTVFNNFNFSNMTISQTRGWTQAYFFYQIFKSEIEAWPVSTQYSSLFEAASMMQSLLGQANATKWANITQWANKKLNKNFTTIEFYNYVRPLVKSIAPCQKCDTMYGIIHKNYMTTCSKCLPSCWNCTNETAVCATCFPGTYMAANGTCLDCPFADCITCNATNCMKCFDGSSLVKGVCQPCQGGCDSCANEAPTTCTTCIFIFYSQTPKDNGQCVTCAQECYDCNTTYPQKCVECQDLFYLDQNTETCKPCEQHCMICESFGCVNCMYGYGLVDGTCQACKTPGCANCNDFLDKCTACIAPHFTFNRSSEVCILTTATSTPKSFYNEIIQCRAGCDYCYDNNTQKCFYCHERYYVYDQYYCKKCSVACLQCIDNTRCLLCVTGYVLSQGACVRCPADCRECSVTDPTRCLYCRQGYKFQGVQGSACVPTDQPECLVYDEFDTSKCIVCMPGYGMNAVGRCIQCMAGCNWTCNYKNIGECKKTRFELGDWFLYEYSLGNEGCAVELHENCVAPEDGYKLVKIGNTFNVTIDCLYPCATCSATECFSCAQGYTFNAGKCSLSYACNPNCPVCLAGSERNTENNNCVACPVQNCAACRNGTCLQCYDGFYFDGTACQACPAKCRKCYDANNCNTCAPGYLWPLQFRVYAYDCVKCHENCLTCKFEANTCTQCAPGMKLINFRCRNQHHVAFTYNLRTDYADFLANTKSETLIAALMRILKVKYNDIFITGIRSGSTIVDGVVSALNQSSARALYNTLKTADLPDFTVNGYSVAFMNDNTTVKCKSKGTVDCPSGTEELSPGAIAGIVVGSVVGVIGIAVAIICCCKRRGSTTKSTKTEDGIGIGSESGKSVTHTATQLDGHAKHSL